MSRKIRRLGGIHIVCHSHDQATFVTYTCEVLKLYEREHDILLYLWRAPGMEIITVAA